MATVPDIRNPSTVLFPQSNNVNLWDVDIQRNRMHHTSLYLVTTRDLLWCRLHTSSYRNCWRKQPFAHSFKKGTRIIWQDSLTLLLNIAKCTWVSLSSVCLIPYNTMECFSFIWGVVHILRNFINLLTSQGQLEAQGRLQVLQVISVYHSLGRAKNISWKSRSSLKKL